MAAVPLALASGCALVAFVNNQITTAFYAAGKPDLHRLCVVMMAVVMIVLIYPMAKLLGTYRRATGRPEFNHCRVSDSAESCAPSDRNQDFRVWKGFVARPSSVGICCSDVSRREQIDAFVRLRTVALGLLGCVLPYGVAGWI